MIKLSVIIKALNEQDNIAQCIESCLLLSQDFDLEIIVVDSLSTDNTVEISKSYPIKVLQFESIKDIGCGSAAQLGYQCANGDYIFLIDGDMELFDDFINQAVLYLNNNPKVAGVAGRLIDKQISNAEDQRRIDAYLKIVDILDVNHLGGGGLYRKKAIEDVIYFSHQGLQAFEELELGLRLKNRDWELKRLPINSVYHSGHIESNFERLKRQWKNGRLGAHGAFLRCCIGKAWFLKALKSIWYLPFTFTINLLFILYSILNLNSTGFILLLSSLWFLIAMLLSLKKKNLNAGFISVITWNLVCLASLLKLFDRIKSPLSKIDFLKIK